MDSANRLVSAERPWELVREGGDARRFDDVLSSIVVARRAVAREVELFLPHGGTRLLAQLGDGSTLPPPSPVFPRLDRRFPSAAQG
ncbi:hypothetical protein EV189_3102 [Motilibacter rhizosphaerae]|uniref:Uncharacterized protein n=1 Tax=Motilibacter rhizosphaerae TaxID=598652 RepID=A0A4Q7NFM2_9ACTN|nr:hypothetical protein [Motilibacter rhizosphaerae]RZS82707.1 hypothetical protein EV189_3102 [Motilibacter rhizosphaerae]